MATIVNNPATSPATIDTGASSAGWIAAIVVLAVAIIAGLYFFNRSYVGTTTPTGTNINVTVPPASTGNSGGSSNTGGTSGTGSSGGTGSASASGSGSVTGGATTGTTGTTGTTNP